MTTTVTLPSFDDVLGAARVLEGVALRTPLEQSHVLSTQLGADVYLKLEHRQRANSFKVRGAYVAMNALSAEQRKNGVTAASAGNHAQGVAFSATALGMPATIVMPSNTPFGKVRRTEQFGANVVLHGTGIVEATAKAKEIAADKKRTFISPYDNANVICGGGTVALEMLADVPDLDVLVVPVGGGGLIAGCALAAKSISPTIKIVGVRSHAAQSGHATVAEGINVKNIGALNAAVVERYVDEIVDIGETALERAIVYLLDEEKSLVEGAGAAGVAAMLLHAEQFKGKRVATILSGGNIDSILLTHILWRNALFAGKVARVRTRMPDVPGGLARVASIIAEHGANVIDVHHSRDLAEVPAKYMVLETTFELRRPGDIVAILASLERAGFSPKAVA